MTNFKSPFKNTIATLLAFSALVPMSACDLANNHTKIDRSTNSEVQDYRDALAPREPMADNKSAADIPDLEPYVADDQKSMRPMPLVSIAINQSIPIREALFELSKQADYDVELDPRIKGSVIFTARDKPLDVVIDRICEIAGLRYKFDDNTIRIELDTPYSKNYKVDYLSFVRKNSSSMKTDVTVASGSDTSSTGGGSNFSVATDSTSDFWAELDANLKQILQSNSSASYLKTDEDPAITLTNKPLPAQAGTTVPPLDASALNEGSAQSGTANGANAVSPQAGEEVFISTPVSVPSSTPPAASTTTTTTTATPAGTTSDTAAGTGGLAPTLPTAAPSTAQPLTPSSSVAAPPVSSAPSTAPTLTIESLPTGLASDTGGTGPNQVAFTPSYSINKQAGIISVYANERQHKQVREYLEALKKASTSQVLIEAKVLEVTLSDEFSAGIDWTMMDRIGEFDIGQNFRKPSFSTTSDNSIAFGFLGHNIQNFVSALSRFGTVHALASPRLTVLNNQSAVLNVARNQVFFKIDLTRTEATDTTAATTDIESEAKTVPEGVLINVMPSIDQDNKTISMQVRPTVTRIVDSVSDPAVAYVAAQTNIEIDSKIPIVNVQEVDSVLNMKSGEMMVMGGLLQDTSTSTQEGAPIVSEIPVVGTLFRNQGDRIKKTELVIFMKATILDSADSSIHQTDRELYRTFGQDRRPHKL